MGGGFARAIHPTEAIDMTVLQPAIRLADCIGAWVVKVKALKQNDRTSKQKLETVQLLSESEKVEIYLIAANDIKFILSIEEALQKLIAHLVLLILMF